MLSYDCMRVLQEKSRVEDMYASKTIYRILQRPESFDHRIEHGW